jgi:hypothetical protein
MGEFAAFPQHVPVEILNVNAAQVGMPSHFSWQANAFVSFEVKTPGPVISCGPIIVQEK